MDPEADIDDKLQVRHFRYNPSINFVIYHFENGQQGFSFDGK